MLVRTLPTDPPREIPRSTWRFTGPGTVTLDRRLRGRPHLRRHLSRARSARGRRRPRRHARHRQLLQARDGRRRQSDARASRCAIGWGVSQTGRFLRHFVYRGLQRRRARPAGVRRRVRSGRRRRPRLVQPPLRAAVTRSAAALQHPLSGGHVPVHRRRPDSIRRPASPTACSRARARSNTVPKFFHVLTDSEYFNRAGSLVHTDVTGTRDVAPPPTSRIYFIASAPHIVGAFPPAPFSDPDFVGRRT